jgi:hypothetical protein
MTRNLKTLGLALVAVMALAAVAASSASAQFEAESAPVTLTRSSNAMQKFAPTKGGTAVECTTIALSNSTQGATPATTVEVFPTYSNCESILGLATSVTTNGCSYLFHLAAATTTGTTDVKCPTGKVIEIFVGGESSPFCKYTIGAQSGLSSVSFKNTGAGTTREVIVEPNVGGITSTRTVSGFGCPSAGSTGTYIGSSTVTGENAAGTTHIGVFVD